MRQKKFIAFIAALLTACSPISYSLPKFPAGSKTANSLQRQGSLVKIIAIHHGKASIGSGGSGIIIDQSGIIATAAHVVAGCSDIFVETSGIHGRTMYLAEVINETMNARLDRVLLRIIGQVDMTPQTFRYVHKKVMPAKIQNVIIKTFSVNRGAHSVPQTNLGWEVSFGDSLECHVAILPFQQLFPKVEVHRTGQIYPVGKEVFIEGYPWGEHLLITGKIRNNAAFLGTLQSVALWQRLFDKEIREAIHFLYPLVVKDEVIVVETSFPCPWFHGLSGGAISDQAMVLGHNISCWPEGDGSLLIAVKF